MRGHWLAREDWPVGDCSVKEVSYNRGSRPGAALCVVRENMYVERGMCFYIPNPEGSHCWIVSNDGSSPHTVYRGDSFTERPCHF